MTAMTLSEDQCRDLTSILGGLAAESDARAAIICDTGGHILSQAPAEVDVPTDTVAVLAAGTFVAALELAAAINEPGFHSTCHRGSAAGVLVHALGSEHLIVLILGEDTVEGLARVCLQKVSVQLESILKNAGSQTVTEAGGEASFEVEAKE